MFRVARGDRAERPAHAAAEDRKHAPEVEAALRKVLPWGREPDDAGKAKEQRGGGAGRGAETAGPRPFGEDEAERAHADEQGGEAGRDELLSPDDTAVTAEQEEGADHGVGAPLVRGGRGCAAEFQEGEEQAAGDEETGSRHEKGRHRLHGDADTEVGAAPDEIDGAERESDGGAGRRGVQGGN